MEGDTKSIASTRVTDFHHFVDSLDPELQERYRAKHYAIKDDEDEEYNRRDSWPWSSEQLFSEIPDFLPYTYEKQHGQTLDEIEQDFYKKFLALPYNWYKKLRCLFLISEHPFVRADARDITWVHQERFFHLVSFPNIIHPYGDFYWIWNWLICLVLLVSLIYEPYLIAFQWTDFATNKLISLLFSILMCLDAFLTFRVGFKDHVTTRVLLDPVHIRREYLRGKFWYNILTRFPYDSVMFMFTANPITKKTELTWIRLVGFWVKILRFEKLYNFFYELTNSLKLSTWTTQIVIHGILVIFCVHWGACLQWLLPDIVNAYYFEENSVYKTHTWITRLSLWGEPTWFQYINAILKSLAIILCLDGGRVYPQETEEIFISTILIFLAVSIVAYFISTYSTMVVDFRRGDNHYWETYACVQEYLRFRKIPKWLQERVLAYFDGKIKNQHFSEFQIFETVTENLKDEISRNNSKKFLEKHNIFSELPKSVISDLMQRFVCDVCVPGDILFSPQRRSDYIYVIEEGYCGVVNEFGVCTQLLEMGQMFGEVDLLCPEFPRKTTIIAMSICNVCKLSKTDYIKCMTLYPEFHEKILALVTSEIKKDFEQISEEMQRIEHSMRWKEAILQEKRTVEEYYEALDAGKVPAYHLEPSVLQNLHYSNTKWCQKFRKRKSKKYDAAAAGTSRR